MGRIDASSVSLLFLCCARLVGQGQPSNLCSLEDEKASRQRVVEGPQLLLLAMVSLDLLLHDRDNRAAYTAQAPAPRLQPSPSIPATSAKRLLVEQGSFRLF